MTSPQRQPAGTPAGGQFAATGHTEADGVRLDTDLLDVEIDEVHNEMPVEVTFVEYDTCTLPQFRPVRTGAGA